MERPPLESFFEIKSPIQHEDLSTESLASTLTKKLKGEKGEKGDKGSVGEKGERGERGFSGFDGEQGIQGPVGLEGKQGSKGERGPQGVEGPRGLQGIDGNNGTQGSPDTPKEIIEKINKSRGEKIKRSRVEGFDELEGLAKSANKNVQNIMSLGGNRQTKLELNGIMVAAGADTLNFIGGTLVPVGDGTTVNYTPPSSGSSSGYQAPLTGGLTGTNTWAVAPNVIVVDQGRAMQKVSTDGTVNWTGTTTTILAVAPNYDIFSTD